MIKKFFRPSRKRINRFTKYLIIITIALGSFIVFSYSEVEYQSLVEDRSYISNQIIPWDIYYGDQFEGGSLENRVNNFRNIILGDKENQWEDTSWIPIFISLTGIDRVNEIDRTIFVRGFVSAIYLPDTDINTPYLEDGSITEQAKKDLLSIAEVDFVDVEQSKWELVGYNVSDSGVKELRYAFEGNLPITRDLSRFPFEKATWEFKMTFPLRAASLYTYIDNSLFYLPNTHVGPYRLENLDCDYAKDQPVCDIDHVRKIGRELDPDRVQEYIDANEEVPFNKHDVSTYEEAKAVQFLDYEPVIGVKGALNRSIGSAYFRYLFPVTTVCSILILIEEIENPEYIELKLGAPPTILLTLIFMQSAYQGQITQVPYLTYLDKIYIIGYIVSFLCLSRSIIEARSNLRGARRQNKMRDLLIRHRLKLATYLCFIFGPVLAWIS